MSTNYKRAYPIWVDGKNGGTPITASKLNLIEDHLETVFNNVLSDERTVATKAELEDINTTFDNYYTIDEVSDKFTEDRQYVEAALATKADSNTVVTTDTFEKFKTDNSQEIQDARDGAISAANGELDTRLEALSESINLTYATKTELEDVEDKITEIPPIPKNISDLTNDVGYVTENRVNELIEEITINPDDLDLTKYATKEYVDETFAKNSDLENLYVKQSELETYTTKAYLQNNYYTKSEIMNEYVNQQQLYGVKDTLTQEISSKVTSDEVDNKISYMYSSDEFRYKTEDIVKMLIDGGYIDDKLTQYIKHELLNGDW